MTQADCLLLGLTIGFVAGMGFLYWLLVHCDVLIRGASIIGFVVGGAL
jgi:hypothetical protein